MKSIAVLLTFTTLILSQQTYDVQVGVNNQPRFTPNNLALVVGDTVRFSFVTTPHTATHGYSVNCTKAANAFFDFSSATSTSATKVFSAVGDYPLISTSAGDCQNGMTGLITVRDRTQGVPPSPRPGPSPIGGSPSNTSGQPRPPATPPPTVPAPAPGPGTSPSPGTTPAPAPGGTPCTDGSFRCTSNDFQKCDHNTWIDFKCPPGTKCNAITSNVILCDYANAPTSGGSTGGTPSGSTGGTVSAECTSGAFQCAGSDFQKCDNGSWILFKCAPGTACRSLGNSNILCDYPGAPSSGGGSPSRR